MDHAVEQRRGHGPGDGAVLGPVPGCHHDGLLRHPVLPDPALQYQGVEGLLHLLGAGIQLVQEQAVGFIPGDAPGRAELAASFHDPGHANDVLRHQLAPKQGDAGQAHCGGELLHDGGFPDPGRAPDKHRPHRGHVQKPLHQLLLIDRNR